MYATLKRYDLYDHTCIQEHYNDEVSNSKVMPITFKPQMISIRQIDNSPSSVFNKNNQKFDNVQCSSLGCFPVDNYKYNKFGRPNNNKFGRSNNINKFGRRRF